MVSKNEFEPDLEAIIERLEVLPVQMDDGTEVELVFNDDVRLLLISFLTLFSEYLDYLEQQENTEDESGEFPEAWYLKKEQEKLQGLSVLRVLNTIILNPSAILETLNQNFYTELQAQDLSVEKITAELQTSLWQLGTATITTKNNEQVLVLLDVDTIPLLLSQLEIFIYFKAGAETHLFESVLMKMYAILQGLNIHDVLDNILTGRYGVDWISRVEVDLDKLIKFIRLSEAREAYISSTPHRPNA